MNLPYEFIFPEKDWYIVEIGKATSWDLYVIVSLHVMSHEDRIKRLSALGFEVNENDKKSSFLGVSGGKEENAYHYSIHVFEEYSGAKAYYDYEVSRSSESSHSYYQRFKIWRTISRFRYRAKRDPGLSLIDNLLHDKDVGKVNLSAKQE
ncbi:hypothetical protein OOT55_02740 [Marinimicrobium sp. C6131]|uniref:hypothetical protein n=1 Tax=Marinimicrobium sp. C6131 TaxID=3022676 RepID=UPI00223CD29F|nr:hypothetical protein [Marinimicrobium sp. C6131]UZJ44990.1 hypothetical protein OOT55_02740 [Marinimicrobium sp. C6131]